MPFTASSTARAIQWLAEQQNATSDASLWRMATSGDSPSLCLLAVEMLAFRGDRHAELALRSPLGVQARERAVIELYGLLATETDQLALELKLAVMRRWQSELAGEAVRQRRAGYSLAPDELDKAIAAARELLGD